MALQDGHRKRLRDRFASQGLEGFEQVNALELLLFYSIPRRNTNDIAHHLLDRFGDLPSVFSASEADLSQVDGVGETTVSLLKLVPALWAYHDRVKNEKERYLLTTQQMGEYLLPFFANTSFERVVMVGLDARRRLLGHKILAQGTPGQVQVSAQSIVRAALGMMAAQIVISHNHPGGFALPSQTDVVATTRLETALALMELTLADHIVVADGDFVSMRQSGYLSK